MPSATVSSSSTSSSSFLGWPTLARPSKGSSNSNSQPFLSTASSYQHYSPSPSFEVRELGPGLFTVADVFTQQQCRRMLQAAEAQGMTPTNPRNLAPPKGHAFRNNERLLVHDPAFADELFEYMRPVLETIVRVEDQAVPCGLSPEFRFYRYVKDAWFGPHIDETQLSADKTMESEFTMLVYLTGMDDDPVLDASQGRLMGGSTRFHHNKKTPIDVEPQTGTVCLHWQLHDCLHEGLRVTGGVKWLLRTDVYFPRLSSSMRMTAMKTGGGEGGRRGGVGKRGGGGKGGRGRGGREGRGGGGKGREGERSKVWGVETNKARKG
ncbi:hypothetical protein VYU27_004026 [Nannochloropsis oceanica]